MPTCFSLPQEKKQIFIYLTNSDIQISRLDETNLNNVTCAPQSPMWFHEICLYVMRTSINKQFESRE